MTDAVRQLAIAVAEELSKSNFATLLEDDRLGYREAEAAEKLGLNSWVLRDARLKGEIKARKLGKGFIYSKQSLLDYLNADPAKPKKPPAKSK